LESEKALDRRITDERLKRPRRPEQTQFPLYLPVSDEAYQPRQFGGLIKQIEPNFVLYGRLYGEELNAERYGWSLGPIQPIYSAAYAFKDMALVPYNFAKRPCQQFETSAGRCYPGDPVPFLLYPFEWSATGAGWEAAVIIAAYALIP